MEAKKHQRPRSIAPPASNELLEARVYRAMLEPGDLDAVLGRVLALFHRAAPFDWAALLASDTFGARLSSAWTRTADGSFETDESVGGAEIGALDPIPEPRESSLPIDGGGALDLILADRGIVRMLLGPLGDGASSRATILLGRRSDTPFPAHARRLLAAVGRSLGTVCAAADRERELERRVDERARELTVLYETSRSVATTLRYEDLVGKLMSSLHSLLDTDIAGILIDVPGLHDISLHLSRPASSEVRAEASEVLREAMLGFAGRPAPPCEIKIVTIDEFEPDSVMVQGRLGSRLVAPLVRRGDAVGALAVFSRREAAFPDRRARLFHTLANQASLTIDRLRTLQEAEEGRLQSIIDSMPNGVLTTDLDFQIAFTNPAARRDLRILADGRVPRVLDALGGVSIADIARPVLSGERSSASVELSIEDQRRTFALTVAPIAGTGAGVAGILIVISDVTDSRLMQEQLQQSEKLSALGEMISGVAHELNNPLASVMGYAQVLRGADVSEEVRRKLHVIQTESQRCQRIVQDLLSFARKHRPEKRPMDVNAVLSSILSLLGYQLRVEGVTIRTRLDPMVPPILGDAHQLQQVFLNIVSNAHQAMREAGSARELEVTTTPEGPIVRVEIRDSGPGISPENLRRIFDPFFTTKLVGQGTGLGLSLAYGIVKDHDGQIYARSRIGRGTTFVVELPVARPTEGVQDGPRATAFEAKARAGTILVVEDETPLGNLLLETLVSRGHEVDMALDGAEALERIERRDYDLVITDVKMPIMDGRRLFEEIRRIRPNLATRVVFSTGDVVDPRTREFLGGSGLRVISKPFDLEEVHRVVSEMLRSEGP